MNIATMKALDAIVDTIKAAVNATVEKSHAAVADLQAKTLASFAAVSETVSKLASRVGEIDEKFSTALNVLDGAVAKRLDAISEKIEARIEAREKAAEVDRLSIASLSNRIEEVKAMPGPAGAAGQDGAAGLDGKSVTDVEMNEAGELVVWLDDIGHNVGQVRGLDGKDGAEVIGFELWEGDGVKSYRLTLADGKQYVVPAPYDGLAGERGEPGEKGIDGVSLAGFVIDRNGHALATLSNGEQKDLGAVVGKDGAAGRDGFGFDDLSVEHDGERGFSFKFQRGDVVKAFDFKLPIALYRGVYSDGKAYEQGDMVTWGGSVWHANEATTGKPEISKAWQLAVKHGREGKKGLDGVDGKDGLRGPPGHTGRDLTRLGQDGSAY